MRALLALCVLFVAPAVALGAELPTHLDLATPFPTVTLQSSHVEQVAPGIEYGDYELSSADGPLSAHVIAADLTNPDVRASAVVAGDTLVSNGETVSSMAQRTGAVGGLNGDYFDIGRTNSPTNIVVREGDLLRTPRKRYALAVLRSGAAHFTEFAFSGTLQFGAQSLPLGGVNTMPAPDADVALLTPEFGAIPPEANVTLIALTLTSGSPPLATYRVDSFAQSIDGSAQPGYYLAVDSQDVATLPNIGDAIAVSGTLSPIPLADLRTAIGGGPLILYNGAWFDDPDGPRGGEYDRRIPCSGAALENDGTLLLIEVDGRQQDRSVGLTRPEFAELMLALGASNGIALDGGGSSEIAVRLPGELQAQLASSPSDGNERRVADGIFLYDEAPIGPPASIAATPQTIHASVGSDVAVHADVVDAGEQPAASSEPISGSVEPATLGTFSDGRFVGAQPGDGRIVLRSGALRAEIPIEVVPETESTLSTPQSLRFMTIPDGGAGSAQADPSCADCVRLAYALGDDERAAYAIVERQLPAGAAGISFDLKDDGSGAELRIALRNAIDEQVLVTARTLDTPGEQHVTVRFPANIAQPVRLVGFYVVATHDRPTPIGTIVIGNVHTLPAGSP